jgi:hypothetical protein
MEKPTYSPMVELREEACVYQIPVSCLQCTIKNDGDSLVFIDDSVELKPGDAYPIPHIPGMHLVGNIKVAVVEVTGAYSDKTLITFRNIIENK